MRKRFKTGPPPKGVVKTDLERFFEKVDKNGPYSPYMDSCCWEWLGARKYHRDSMDRSHGLCSVRIGNTTKWKTAQAHRRSYEIHKGPIPEGMVVRHLCHFGLCVNPDHLVLGTKKDNALDLFYKGEKDKLIVLSCIRRMIELGKTDEEIAKVLWP